MGLARVRIWFEEKTKTKLTDDVVSLKKKKEKVTKRKNYVVIQWLRLHAFATKGTDSISSQGTKISQDAQHSWESKNNLPLPTSPRKLGESIQKVRWIKWNEWRVYRRNKKSPNWESIFSQKIHNLKVRLRNFRWNIKYCPKYEHGLQLHRKSIEERNHCLEIEKKYQSV